jgi:vacuolar-type H+-ATPase subunit H
MINRYLRRFRHVLAPPGPAGPMSAIPQDQRARLEAEVEPLLNDLGVIEAEVVAIRDAAGNEASLIRAQAEREALVIVEAAQAEAAAAHLEIDNRVAGENQATQRTISGDAEREVMRISRRAEELLPVYLSRVRRAVRAIGTPAR